MPNAEIQPKPQDLTLFVGNENNLFDVEGVATFAPGGYIQVCANSLRTSLNQLHAQNSLGNAYVYISVGSVLAESVSPLETFTFFDGRITVSPEEAIVLVDGKTVPTMPAKEFSLVSYLGRNAGLVRTRTQIMEGVWGQDYSIESRTVDVHIRRARQKIPPEAIRTRIGLGYVAIR